MQLEDPVALLEQVVAGPQLNGCIVPRLVHLERVFSWSKYFPIGMRITICSVDHSSLFRFLQCHEPTIVESTCPGPGRTDLSGLCAELTRQLNNGDVIGHHMFKIYFHAQDCAYNLSNQSAHDIALCPLSSTIALLSTVYRKYLTEANMITAVRAAQRLDSRGNPTVQVEVETASGER